MLIRERQASFLSGGSALDVEGQAEFYLADPAPVTGAWRAWSLIGPQLREIVRSGAGLLHAGPPASAATVPGYHAAYVARRGAFASNAFAE